MRCRAGVGAALVVALAACTDPRARPMPPDVQVSFTPGLVVVSPDTLLGTLFVHDVDGLERVHLAIRSSDSTLVLDSTVSTGDGFTVDRSLFIVVPDSVAAGTRLLVIGSAVDFIGFQAADTISFTIQDAPPALRRSH